MSLPKPYYQDESCTIYHADCREILPYLQRVDLVLTDPPYGVGFTYASYEDLKDKWYELMGKFIPLVQQKADMVIMPSCQIKELPWIYANHPPDWLWCWYKGSPGHVSHVGFNDWEPLLVYGRTKGLSAHDYFYCQPEQFNTNGHPCTKPIKWAYHLISKTTKEGQTILDPFMGSGTTGVACKQLGRKFIGIEIEEKYCKIAIDRLRQEVLPLHTPETNKQEEQGDLL